MPYQTNDELPASIKDHLPKAAQTIFRKTFNAAHKTYGNEEQAFKVAWSAVKKQYKKNESGRWIKKK